MIKSWTMQIQELLRASTVHKSKETDCAVVIQDNMAASHSKINTQICSSGVNDSNSVKSICSVWKLTARTRSNWEMTAFSSSLYCFSAVNRLEHTTNASDTVVSVLVFLEYVALHILRGSGCSAPVFPRRASLEAWALSRFVFYSLSSYWRVTNVWPQQVTVVCYEIQTDEFTLPISPQINKWMLELAL